MGRIVEKPESREVTVSATSPSATLHHHLAGLTEYDDAAALLESELPPAFLTMPLQGYTLSPLGGGVWTAESTYTPRSNDPLDGQGDPSNPPSQPEPPGVNDPLTAEYSFDTTGKTQRITQSVETRKSAAVGGGAAPDYGRAIGVSKDGVAGTDKVTPQFEFQVTHQFRFLTLNYLLTLRNLTGTMNSAPFLGFAKGELLFLGATGQASQNWRVTFKFLAGKNRDSVIIIGPDNAPELELDPDGGEPVYGHDYVWVAYADDVDGNDLIQKAKAAYLERLYEFGDFALMGIA